MTGDKRVAIINSVPDKSTGKICCGLLEHFHKKSIKSFFCYGYGPRIKKENMYRIDTYPERYFHILMTRLTGYQGYYSLWATRRLLSFLDEKNINVIYGVGLHGYYLNEKMFFDYIAEKQISYIYIMTEEYPFYGKCGYSNKCTNYLTGCGNCPYLKEYPKSLFFDRTRQMFEMKRKAYYKIKEKSIFVGPEYTILEGKKSPLLDGIKTEVIDEAINTDFYFPRDTNNIKDELNITDEKVVILCIAPSSQGKKGTKYFTELARRFEDDNHYVFLHVGFTDSLKGLPKNYIPVGYVTDQEKLAQYYSIGDLFVFPSLLDTMPNTCLEALSCGVPLLCFNTSGMPYLGNDSVLKLVDPKNIDQLEEIVKMTGKKSLEQIKKCREYAVKRYSSKNYFERLERVMERL